MTETEKAYLAGLIDGEGSIFISHSTRKHYVRNGETHAYNREVPVYWMCVKVGMTSKEAVDFFASKVGKVATKHGDVWETRLYSRQAAAFLKEIFPYLVTKKKRAAFALCFQTNILTTRKGYRLTDQDIITRELCVKISSLLNHEESMSFHGKAEEFGERLNSLWESMTTMLTPSQASEGKGSEEGVTTSQVSPNNNPGHELPLGLN